jgi:polyvinyl alcohol dehydrogenase (cytochrome)
MPESSLAAVMMMATVVGSLRSCGSALVLSSVALLVSPFALAQSPGPTNGDAVYQQRCAACHEQVSPRIPHRDALRAMPAARILRALDSGAMMAIALTMHRDDRVAVAAYLGTDAAVAGPSAAAFCSDRSVTIAPTPQATWNGWSPTADNARFQPAEIAGLRAAQVAGLELKWAFGFAGDVTAFAPPTVLDGQVFVGSAAGLVHAMRAESGCLQWVFQTNGPVRSALVATPLDGEHVLVFGDMTGWFYALRARTGTLVWKAHIETHDSTRLTAAPVVHDGIVYVPVSSWEETRAADPEYPCCTFRGSIAALRVSDGARLWQTYMTDVPKEIGKSERGGPLYGPSGVGIWASPTVDARRGLLYVTTGDNYSHPATPTSDAVIALEMTTGRMAWVKQMTPGDVYNSSCGGDRVNCPGEFGPDYDFGSSAILVARAGRPDVLLVGQKSGIVYALDPQKEGEILWQTRVGQGGTNGGVQWGMATDGEHVYATVSDVGRTRQAGNPFDTRRYILDPNQGGGLTALRVADGSRVWHVAAAPCPEGAPVGCSPSQPGAVTLIPGAVFTTSTDGHIRAHATEDGRVLWDFATAREFAAVNQVPARGGSIDGPGAVVVNGTVFIGSGYPRNGGMPGNVLLAFGVE